MRSSHFKSDLSRFTLPAWSERRSCPQSENAPAEYSLETVVRQNSGSCILICNQYTW